MLQNLIQNLILMLQNLIQKNLLQKLMASNDKASAPPISSHSGKRFCTSFDMANN